MKFSSAMRPPTTVSYSTTPAASRSSLCGISDRKPTPRHRTWATISAMRRARNTVRIPPEISTMKKLSIGSWAFIFNQQQPTNDFHQVLHKLHDLGYEGVELGSFGTHPTPWSHPTKADRQRLKKEVADHGLAFSGIAVDLWSFHKPGPSIMDENPTPYVAAFLGFATFAADLGIKTIRVDAVEPPNFFETTGKDIGPKLGMDRLVIVWDRCSKIAADHGMNVCWEFEPGFVFNKPSEVLRIVDAVRAKGNSNFGVLFDTCHAYMSA